MIEERRGRRPPALQPVPPYRRDNAVAWRSSVRALPWVCAASAALVLVVTRHEWFHSDEWDFLTTRVGRRPPTSVWVPHNEHPSVIPILVWRGIFAVVGMRSYLPYMIPLVLAHLALVVVVWVAARRCGAGPAAALGAASVLAFCGAGQQDMVSAFQFSFVGSVLATWVATLLTDHPAPVRGRPGPGRPPSRLVLTWVVLVGGLCCSLVSLPLLLLPFGVAWARRELRSGVLTVVVPLAGFAVWFLLEHRHDPAVHPRTVAAAVPAYVAHGLVSTFGSPIGLPGSGPVAIGVLAVAVALLVRTMDRAAPEVPAVIALATVVGYFAFVSVGRTDLGVGQAGTSRYVYIGVALVLPACAVLTSRGRARVGRSPGRLARGVVAAVTTVAVLGVAGIDARGAILLLRERNPITAAAQSVQARFAVALHLLATGQQLIAAASVNPGLGLVPPASLLRLRAEGAFGHLRSGDAAQRAAAQLRLEVAVVAYAGSAAPEPDPWSTAVGLAGTRPVPVRALRVVAVLPGTATATSVAGCLNVGNRDRHTTIVLATPTGGGQDIVGLLQPGHLWFGLETATTGSGVQWSRSLGPVGTGRYRLVSTAVTARLLLTVDQPIRICGPRSS